MLKWYEYRYYLEEGGPESGPAVNEYGWLVPAENLEEAKVKAESELNAELGARKYIPGGIEEADQEVVREWEREFDTIF